MSSGHSEGPSTNPDDWKSPYGTGPGPASGDDRLAYDRERSPQGYSSGHDRASGDPAHTGQGYGAPAYADQGYGAHERADQGYGQGYPGQAYTDHGHAGGYGDGGYTRPDHGSYPGGYGQGYAEQPYGAGHDPVASRNAEGVRTHAIIVLAVGIVLSLSCFLSIGGLVSAVLSGIALGRVDSDPRGARGLLRWAWISIGVNVGLLVLGVAAFIVAGLNDAFSA
ncbi:hypothetical protein ACIBCT_29365 [Streptosporangium sp. NPDC050855]|uniref:hypothetical protein n=1 Tax=Streptosporangium sp. NPDC050855 TaxID=3366194 RepID=UPI003787F861